MAQVPSTGCSFPPVDVITRWGNPYHDADPHFHSDREKVALLQSDGWLILQVTATWTAEVLARRVTIALTQRRRQAEVSYRCLIGHAGPVTAAPDSARTVVYTDGACSGNPGPGGWAWAVPGGRFRSGRENPSTNQRMEIAAALDAVRTLDGPLEVVSDSTYVVHCFRDRWWEGWMARGWKNSAKKDVANQDLWKPFVEAYRADPTRVHFRWVKGHSGDPMNDLVDRLAVEAATTQQPREGAEPPTSLGPADQPRAAAEPSIPGHLIAVTGLRPPELGGYSDNPIAEKVKARITEIVAAQASLHPDLVVASGLGLGAEQLGAQAALDAGVPLAAVLAFPGVDEVWPAPSRQRFAELLAAATHTVTVQTKRPTSKQQAGGALARRDEWLARNSAEALVVWDGNEANVGRTVRSLQDHLGEEQVWVLEPQ